VSAAKQFYLQLTEVEQAFKELKGDLAVRPIYHQFETRIESHIFISFLAYCLQVTLKARLKKCAAGLTPRAVLEKFAAVQMIDVHLPTTDEREIIMSRYTQPEKDLQLLLDQLKLTLPEQDHRAEWGSYKKLSPATSKCTTCGHFKVHHPGNVW
jgi:transposase